MCDIVGIINFNDEFVRKEKLQGMINVFVYRGSNGEGFYLNENKIVVLGCRRLSILDLSENALQPIQLSNNWKYIMANK